MKPVHLAVELAPGREIELNRRDRRLVLSVIKVSFTLYTMK